VPSILAATDGALALGLRIVLPDYWRNASSCFYEGCVGIDLHEAFLDVSVRKARTLLRFRRSLGIRIKASWPREAPKPCDPLVV